MSPAGDTNRADDALTITAISVLSEIVADVLHEGFGHAAIALLTGTKSGVLTTVAWSSVEESTRLVAAGGTLVNLVAALVFWLALRSAKNASIGTRYFLLISCAFNLLTGTGYFFFSGVTNFGDWANVIDGLAPHWMWRTLLIVFGAATYYTSVLVVGVALVRYVGAPRNESKRLRKLTLIPYVTAVVLACAAAALNPLGVQLIWQSALAATGGGQSGLLWLQYYIPRETVPERARETLGRSYGWIGAAVACAVPFIFVLGRGITLHG